MKEKKLLDALNEIDEEFIEEAEPENKKVISLKWVRNVACFILAIGIGIAIWNLTKKSEPEIIVDDPTEITLNTEKAENEYTFEEETAENEYSFIEEGNTEIVIEGICETIDENFWKNLSINQQYNNVSYKGSEYYNNNTKISSSDIGEKIKNSKATGTDPFDNKSYTKEVSVYKMKNISDKIAVAVKFEESESFFVYANYFCEFETLGEIIEELSLKDNMKISTGYYEVEDIAQIKYEKIDSSVVWKMLLNDASLKAVEEPNKILLPDFSVQINVSPFTSQGVISVTKDGYLIINIFHRESIFVIGEEKAEKFIDYIIENYKGKRLVATTEQPVVYNGAKEEIPVTEVFSNGFQP